MGQAQAQQAWSFSYSGDGVTASGVFTTAGPALTFEDILSISGTRNGAAITGLVPLDSDPDFVYDNQFRSVGDYFTEGGMLFSVLGGTSNVNVYFFDGAYIDISIDGLDVTETAITFNVSAVPEPATVLSMLAGLGLVGAALRHGRKQA
jgi:PEP-CTERM motif